MAGSARQRNDVRTQRVVTERLDMASAWGDIGAESPLAIATAAPFPRCLAGELRRFPPMSLQPTCQDLHKAVSHTRDTAPGPDDIG